MKLDSGILKPKKIKYYLQYVFSENICCVNPDTDITLVPQCRFLSADSIYTRYVVNLVYLGPLLLTWINSNSRTDK